MKRAVFFGVVALCLPACGPPGPGGPSPLDPFLGPGVGWVLLLFLFFLAIFFFSRVLPPSARNREGLWKSDGDLVKLKEKVELLERRMERLEKMLWEVKEKEGG